MSGREFTPDFDWLKRGIENREPPQPPATPPKKDQPDPPDAVSSESASSESVSSEPVPSEPSPSGSGLPVSEENELQAEDTVDPVVLDDIADIPPPSLNSSDGTTLVLKNDQFDQDGFRESAGNSGILYPTEQFTDPGAPLDVPISSEATDAELPVFPLPEELQHESGSEIDAGNGSAKLESDESVPSPDDPKSNEVTPPTLDDHRFEIPPPDENEPPPPRAWLNPLARGVDSKDVSIDRDTDLPQSAKTTEYPAGSSNWADFVAPAAAGAAAGGLAGLDRGSSGPLVGKGGGDFLSGGTVDPPVTRKSTGDSSSPNPGAERRRMILLGGYAAVVTVALLMFVLKDLTEWFRPHHLESLPDIPAEKVENLSYVPANMRLPKGHTLALGTKQRFGNILVEPLKITSEPAEFTHYSGDPKRKREATAPVWKLWLKFTNVSEDQDIAPLDRRLVLRWVSKARQNWDFTNQYIAEQGAKTRNTPSLQLYRMPAQGDWDLKDQDLGHVLKPGESYVTYLAASDEGAEELGDQLVWRVQMRKGYSSKGNGVTTIFEVPFRKNDVLTQAS